MSTVAERFAEVIIDTGDENKILEVMQLKWEEAKRYKNRRGTIVKQNMCELLKIEQQIHDYTRFFNRRLDVQNGRQHREFVSPMMAAVIEKKSGSDWVPTIVFQPQQRLGPGVDTFLARNSNRVHDMILDDGKFFKEAQAASTDLFVAGRCFIQKGWKTKNNDGIELPSMIQFRQRDWTEVYWTKDKHHWFIATEYTHAELINDFGEGINSLKIHEGQPFTVNDRDNSKCLNFDDAEDRAKKIVVLQYFNDTGKVFAISIGGSKDLFSKQTGDNYSWTDEVDDGFIPIDYFDGHQVQDNGFPLSDIDYIVHIWRSYSIYFSAVIERAKKSARAREIIASSDDPTAARKMWMQSEADWADGFDIPHFTKLQGVGDTFSATTLDIGVDTGNPLALRDMFYDEVEMVTGVNLRALGRGAPTAEQERLRLQRELDTITELIKINQPQWEHFSLTNMQMLSGVDSDFLEEHVAIEDVVSDEGGLPEEGTVRDIINDLEGFPFNVKVSVNHSNEKRRQISLLQKQEALSTLAPFFPGAPGISEMAREVALEQFPNLKFNEESFIATMAPNAPVAGRQLAPPIEQGALT
jgi:hypothetical protein